jgi:hypothetical protein
MSMIHTATNTIANTKNDIFDIKIESKTATIIPTESPEDRLKRLFTSEEFSDININITMISTKKKSDDITADDLINIIKSKKEQSI